MTCRPTFFGVPFPTVAAGVPIQFAAGAVAGVGVEDPPPFEPPRLRIGELRVRKALPIIDPVRVFAAENGSGPARSTAACEDPKVPVIVDRKRTVVMRVVDRLLVHDNDRAGGQAGGVIEV